MRGLAPEGELHPLQQSFLDARRLAVRVLHARDDRDREVVPGPPPARPDREELRRALSGNLCRCTGYTKILDALEAYRDVEPHRWRPRLPVDDRDAHAATSVCRAGPGVRKPHSDFIEKVAGTLPYADDWGFPGMLHGVVVRAQLPCARITGDRRHRGARGARASAPS